MANLTPVGATVANMAPEGLPVAKVNLEGAPVDIRIPQESLQEAPMPAVFPPVLVFSTGNIYAYFPSESTHSHLLP